MLGDQGPDAAVRAALGRARRRLERPHEVGRLVRDQPTRPAGGAAGADGVAPGGEVFGRRAVPSLLDLDEAPDLAILSIPAAAVEQAVADAATLGVRAVAVIAAGFGEMGEDGLALQDRLVATARAADMLLLGPELPRPARHARGPERDRRRPADRRRLADLAERQPRARGGAVADGRAAGLRAVRVGGNQADLTVPDLLWSLVDHEPTRVVTAYVEDPKDGRAFVAAVRALAEAGKPPLVIVGRSHRHRRPRCRSHTGSLAGEARVFAAALRDAGGIPVATPGELVDRARALLGGARTRAAGGWRYWRTAAGTARWPADLLTDARLRARPAAGGDGRGRAAVSAADRRSRTRSTWPAPASPTSSTSRASPTR